jgi:hypothetical protein
VLLPHAVLHLLKRGEVCTMWKAKLRPALEWGTTGSANNQTSRAGTQQPFGSFAVDHMLSQSTNVRSF